MRLSYREMLTKDMSFDHPETAEKMLSIAWDYHFASWSQVPRNRKKGVYRSFCYEVIEGGDCFYDKATRDDFGTLFASIENLDEFNNLDQEVVNNFARNIVRRYMRNADSILEMIFEEQKPSEEELRQAAREERESLKYGY